MSTALEQLTGLQDRIHAWCGEQFPEQTELTILAHLEEEVVELRQRGTPDEAADCLILLLAWAAHTGLPLASANTSNYWTSQLVASSRELTICAELGQERINEARTFIALLIGWSALSGHDILAAAEAKHAINLTRQWRRGDDGIHRHVEVQR